MLKISTEARPVRPSWIHQILRESQPCSLPCRLMDTLLLCHIPVYPGQRRAACWILGPPKYSVNQFYYRKGMGMRFPLSLHYSYRGLFNTQFSLYLTNWVKVQHLSEDPIWDTFVSYWSILVSFNSAFSSSFLLMYTLNIHFGGTTNDFLATDFELTQS